jgi:serpin B
MYKLAILVSVASAVFYVGPVGSAEEPIDRAALVRGNTAFALELYARLRQEDNGNVFLSPYSISTALAMTYAGARNQTATQMEEVLHFPREQERLHPACAALMRTLNTNEKSQGHRLNTANAVWVQTDYDFRKDYLNTLKTSYGAGLQEIDFAADPEIARKTINTWAEKETQGKIKDILKPGILDRDTRFALANAIYFKGNWVSQFKVNETRDGNFWVPGKEPVRIPLMHQQKPFRYLHSDNFQALELPYVGKDLSMVIFLPQLRNGLAAFEKSLTADKLTGYLAKLRGEEVKVTLPKFKATGEFRLDKVLGEMGMAAAFTPAEADFSGMTERKRLYIKAVVHKAFVEVNEEGTEAAAATVVTGGEESAPLVHEFHADHPFFFLIRDTRSDAILFLGQITNPAK